jgi:ATP-dependent RNA helicase DeaD
MERRTISLNKIRIVVLDEADQMLDIGFAPDIERILRRTPKSRQTMLFSATMPHLIKRLVNRYLSNPVWTRVGGESEPVTQVEQIYYEVAERDRALAIVNILGEPGAIEQALVFRRTKMGVDKLMLHLKRKGYEVEAIHGDMPQTRRDRVMSGFRKKLIPILIATNVAARGLDIPAVSHVINYDMPSNLEEYVHRIGRTARMGRPGTAITFVSEWDFDTLDLIRSHVGEDLKRQHLSFLYT